MSGKVWFTADLHLGHTNVIKYSNRPFGTVQEMNESLVRNWNACVRPGDRVYVLGDLSFQKPEGAAKTLARLMGQIYLVKGNHDRDKILEACEGRFVWVKDYFELKYEEQKMILCHYPFLTWRGSHKGAWNLHGHCHGSLQPEVNRYARRLDVGVDVHNYRPIEFTEIREILNQREFKPVDHHGKKEEDEEDV